MKVIFVIIVFMLYIFLFKKAAGILKPNIMNVITFVFYSILGFELIGGSLIFLGFDNHYLIQKISSETTINKTYYILAYTAIMLPVAMILCNKYIFKIDSDKKELEERYVEKLKEEVDIKDKKSNDRIFICLAILGVIGLIATIYVFICIGYVPLLQYLNSDFDFAVERINISRNFTGNTYVKNLIMLLIPPIISYIAYIYMRVLKEKRWIYLFITLFILSVLALTYNFEKSIILYYILFFLMIEITLGKTFNFKKIIPILCACVLIVLILYKVIMRYDGPIFSLSSGPISRILITQVSTLFLHIDAFPENIEYLKGQSFPEELFWFMGYDEYDVRSGREVMELYSPSAVKNGTAGVMNSLFVGEAYANFGILGVILAPVFVGFVFSAILAFFLKSKKTPINIIIYIESFIIFKDVLQGGFVDFFYNIKFVAMLIMMLGMKKIIRDDRIWEKIKKIELKIKERM